MKCVHWKCGNNIHQNEGPFRQCFFSFKVSKYFTYIECPRLQHTKAHSARQQLDSQLNENKMVKEVMDTLGDADNVYKLVGPALIKQDVSEAKQV